MDSVLTEVFEQEGFRKIGSLTYRIQINIWWNPDSKVQVLELPLGPKALLKGSKAYFMQSITEQGETWAREIGPLQSYLEAHFPELHIKFSYFRDITDTLAATQIQRKIESQASSIKIPILINRATIEIILILTPKTTINPRPPKNEIGKPSAIQKL